MIGVRQLFDLEEFREAVALQEAVWGFAERDLVPVRSFVVANKIGGHSFGAYDDDRMVGFLYGIPAFHGPENTPYIHSQMLGVLPEYRNAGLGRLMKLAQREEALNRKLSLVEWTFDPLEIKNAFFNMERLGAVVRRFSLNFYGATTSHLHGGLPTDRCVAEWWVNSPRANAIVAGEPFARNPVEARISVPNDIADLRTEDPSQARAIQQQVSEQFVENIGKGLAVIGFERSETHGTYLFGQWESK
ncbi:MAG: GNAT family N-acetyltransferase [Acidobacteria bacterium]|nr:GNAT family N-acetyltransferase [Acidobacteriota bacterium]